MTGKPDVECVVEIRGAICRGSPEHGRQAILGPLDLQIGTGEFVCVVGPRASGKSALLRMIAGLLPGSGGTILSPPSDIGFVFKDTLLMPWRTAVENILLVAELRGGDISVYGQRARRLLGLVGAAEYENSAPRNLPPGMAVRIAICRAAIHSPPLVLMDDPFQRLDPLEREGVWTDLQRLWCNEHFAVLMATTHISEAVHLGDRVVVLSKAPGRIVETIGIELPRPRRIDKSTTPLLWQYSNRVRTLLQAQGVLP